MTFRRGAFASRLLSICIGGAMLAYAPDLVAQPRSMQPQQTDEPNGQPATTTSGSWSSYLTPSVAQRLLTSSSRDDRIRGVRRLAAHRDFAAVQLLLRAATENAVLVTDPAVRLEAIRAFAPFAARDPVRHLLVEWMSDAPMRGRPAGGLALLAQQQAAFALASTGDLRAIEQLVLAVADGGDTGDRAAQALLAHPPPNLAPLLSKRSLESAGVLRLLGHLGDLRALHALRKTVDSGDVELRADAAVALARLGDSHGRAQAHKWLHQDGTTYPVRVAAALTLAALRDPEAPRAIAILLADAATRAEGLKLAAEAPTPQLAPSLAGLLTIATAEDRPRILMALARCGGPLAARTLEPLVTRAPPDLDAAFALASCRDESVSSRITRMLGNPTHRRLALRIALARVAIMGEQPEGLDQAIEALAHSKDASDRATAALGQALSDPPSVPSLAASQDDAVVSGACRATLALGRDARVACARRLREDTPPALRDVLAMSLLDDVQPQALSTAVLLAWAEQPVPSAAVFARCLGPRDDQLFRARIVRLLQSGDPVLRSQVALGLGRSQLRSTVQLLVDAYAFEPEPVVRRAIVRALSRAHSVLGKACLEQAKVLDPDDEVRSLARLALAGRALDVPFRGHRLAWITVAQNTQGGGTAQTAWDARLLLPNGFVVTATADPDGLLLVPGVPAGKLLTWVAAVPATEEATGR